MADTLLCDGYVEDGPKLDKEACELLLSKIRDKSDIGYSVIININTERGGVYYDYVLEASDTPKLIVSE